MAINDRPVDALTLKSERGGGPTRMNFLAPIADIFGNPENADTSTITT